MPSAKHWAAVAVTAILASSAMADETGFNRAGNLLISDQFNNRVIEISPSGHIVWQFGLGPNDVSDRSPIAANDAARVGDMTLISAPGAPPGSEPMCPAGCPDNRVLLVDQEGRVAWQYGTFGVTGSGRDQLNAPVQATWTPNHTVLITDQGNQRVIEVNLHKQIIWQYGVTGVAGHRYNQLNNPNSVEQLDNGNYLIADQSNNRAIEVNRKGRLVASFTAGGTLSGVAFASRLGNGDTLITDTNNSRVVEVNAHDKIVWSFVTNADPGSNPAPLPSRAVRLQTGETLISDQFNNRVILVGHDGRITRQFGTLDTPGYDVMAARAALNGPYDAKRIGDVNGLTWSDSLHILPH
jgi:outer membrane protein assembly factor BamB